MSKTAYWLTFADRGPASAWIESEAAARELGAQHGEVLTCQRIGYPARPRLDGDEGWGAGQCPSFCVAPKRCAASGASCVNPNGRGCTS